MIACAVSGEPEWLAAFCPFSVAVLVASGHAPRSPIELHLLALLHVLLHLLLLQQHLIVELLLRQEILLIGPTIVPCERR
jgi:hypothetical protein